MEYNGAKKRDFDQNYASIDVSILYIFLSVGGFVGISQTVSLW